VAWVGLVTGSCAAVEGIGGFTSFECGDQCDAAADHAVVAKNETTTFPDAGGSDDASQPTGDDADVDASPPVDTDSDTPPVDGAAIEASVPEAGCGLGTTASCSACGVACNTSTGTPSCKGST
jgi:hypothetical protein